MNIAYILILFAHVGPMGDGNSNALSMHEFSSAAKCNDAGNAAKQLANGSTKTIEFKCVPK